MTSFTSPEGSRRATQIPECNRRISNCAPRNTRRLAPTLSTFEEERQEAMSSVLHSLATEEPDPERTAACLHLLRHLTSVMAHH